MKTVIIEDEEPAARRLKKMLLAVSTGIEVTDILDSVESSVKYFNNHNSTELIFMDIQLSDGLCFEIFKQSEIDIPIIFTTAFNEYAIQAFKVNSIDYLLKPIDEDELKRSIDKFYKMKERESGKLNSDEIDTLINILLKKQPAYKSRFLVKSGQVYIKISSDEIACFYVENKLTYILLKNGKKFFSDFTLDELERDLDPHRFFRANRQYILSDDSIQNVQSYFNGKLKVNLNPKSGDAITISRLKANSFKEWLNR